MQFFGKTSEEKSSKNLLYYLCAKFQRNLRTFLFFSFLKQMLAKYVQIFVFVEFSATIIRHISAPVAN